MTPPTEQLFADSDLLPDSYPVQSVDARPMNVDVHIDESPEVLRWRAEFLLDEMMLGAVDASAGEPRSPFAYDARTYDTDFRGHHDDGEAPLLADTPPQRGAAVFPAPSGRGATATSAPHLGEPPPAFTQASDGDRAAPNRGQGAVVAVEQRYARYAVNQNQAASPTLSANGGNGAGGLHGPVDYGAPPLGPVRRTTAATLIANDNTGVGVGSMSVGGRGVKYANLLPRSSTWDVREMQREIVALHGEIDALLPTTHSTNQRAHHLLDRANDILSSDPLRSAEVDYYLAQVRAIVQRASQNVEWSAHYRQRLLLYLSAWIGLSLIMLAGCFLYGDLIAAILSDWFAWGAGSRLEAHTGFLLTAVFAGALGASAGALLTMRRSAHRKYGFIDRKYSLRTLVLPVMGMIVGLALYLIFGVVAWALDYVPDQSMWLPLAPALIAFAFGLIQESLYGTRE